MASPGPPVTARVPGPSPEPDVLARAGSLYRDLHAHPELSGTEERTAARFASALREIGCEVTTGIGGHGVVGVLANGAGPAVMLRAELDALPVAERTGLPYASTATALDGAGRRTPVMHACGHDLHLAAAVGATAHLARRRDGWRGTLLVLGQPAEETLSGAAALVADGLHERFGRPDLLLAQHAAPLPAGMVAHGAGPMTAGCVTLEVTVTGRGGHAATPHLCVDPVVLAATIVVQLQTVVARQVGPAEQVSLTVGSLRAGHHPGVIPEDATLGVTIRALSDRTLDDVLARVTRVVRACCEAAGSPVEPVLRVVSRTPAYQGDPAVAARLRAAHERAFGAERVAWWPPSLAAEDFPLLAAGGIPSGYWMLGVVGPRQWRSAPGASAAEKLAGLPANHSPSFAPDAGLALPAGVAALAAGALTALAPE
ncbi:amidohydrolase [Micromonospora sp. WMMD1128]|uniref:amidohydrolase n=1 Tax=unclassified Micromonospora TaxID=2617518 RepID=UPI00248C2031|nr:MULTISPECIES: amidohydrolase [unclassified Micromonospora]WBB71509.1 amidohydrolase [Micromonospora sp. WMMD1128]WFE35043.1 amidohydrolase [Micromonospora sp. WMMD975]